MKKLKTLQEELDTTPEEIAKAEKVWGAPFPEEFKAFLLENNGLIVYPDFPRIGAENNAELWPIERFMSIGDIILQKQYPMDYTNVKEHDEYDLKELNLNPGYLVTFALGQRGCYYVNLDKKDIGQIYFCNYSGGDGLVRVQTNSFDEFMDSIFVREGDEEDYDPNFEMKPYFPGNKIFKPIFFQTDENPELGLERFKEVFAKLKDLNPPEKVYSNLIYKYVNDRLKLDFLIAEGCNTEGILRNAVNPEIIEYLVKEKGFDINQAHNGRYPLQAYLTPHSTFDIKMKYQLVDALLEKGIELDWTVLDQTEEPLLDKLGKLHVKYYEFEKKDMEFWIKNGRPSGFIPFKRSPLIEALLGIEETKQEGDEHEKKKGWFSNLFKRSNKKKGKK